MCSATVAETARKSHSNRHSQKYTQPFVDRVIAYGSVVLTDSGLYDIVGWVEVEETIIIVTVEIEIEKAGIPADWASV